MSKSEAGYGAALAGARPRLAALAALTGLALIGGCDRAANTHAQSAPSFGPSQQPVYVSGGSGAPVNAGNAVFGGANTFTDPSESAYTVSLPPGWQAKGGVARKSETDAKPWLTATSNDGSTSMFYNDPQLPMFALPDARTAAGTVRKTPQGDEPVMDYMDASSFAADYAKRQFGSACGAMQPLGGQPEPELKQKAQAEAEKLAQAFGAQVPSSASTWDGASARFSCQVNGAPYVVTIFDVTTKIQIGQGGLWHAATLFGYRTPVSQQGDTDQKVRAIVASYQRTPAWDDRMLTAGRQALQQMQAEGRQQMAALQQQEAQGSAMLNQQFQNNMAAGQARHNAFMNNFNAQGDARNAAFAEHMYNKETVQQGEMRYIQNKTCIGWWDEAHTRCRYTAEN